MLSSCLSLFGQSCPFAESLTEVPMFCRLAASVVAVEVEEEEVVVEAEELHGGVADLVVADL